MITNKTLYMIIAIIGITFFVGGTIVGMVHILIICPIMQRRAARRGDMDSWTDWLCHGDDRLYFKLAVVLAVIGLVICFGLGSQ